MTEIKIVLGPNATGKSHYINKNYKNTDYYLMNIREYHDRMLGELAIDNMIPYDLYYKVLSEAQQKIVEDAIDILRTGRSVVMEHTLFKAKRRTEYIEKIRSKIETTREAYQMTPSKEQWLRNVKKAELDISIEAQEEEFEAVNSIEGFDAVYQVKDNGIIKKIEEKPFLHICEVCGKEAILLSEEAYQQGWDYPPRMGKFGVLSPRTCEQCTIEKTLWWKVKTGKESIRGTELNNSQKTLVRRIQEEPGCLYI